MPASQALARKAKLAAPAGTNRGLMIVKIEAQKIHPLAMMPKRATDGAGGLDLASCMGFDLGPGESRLVPTCLIVAIPKGWVGLIWPRSGLDAKHGITTRAGVVDSDYRGEVKVLLHNTSDKPHRVLSGERIAQLVVVPCLTEVVGVSDLGDMRTARGAGGFGSTGR